MTPPPPTAPEDDAWAGDRVARWLRQSAGLERQLAPVSDVLFAAADLQPGERVVDVGCGTGPTTRQAAMEVGPTGAVTGLDISGDMLAAAAKVDVETSAAPLDWVITDVASWTPAADVYDVVLSRFGVMFFPDPAAAFSALAAATRPGGRLAVAVWAHRDESELFAVPLRATLGVLHARGLPEPDGLAIDGGPFSLGDVDATRALLGAAGWSDVETVPHRLTMRFGGGLDPAGAAEAAADFGPTRLAMGALDEAGRRAASAAIAAVFADHLDDDGLVVLDGQVHVVTARR